MGANEWPPALKRWLQKSLSGLSSTQTTQGQQELKAVVKSMMENKVVWDIEWDEQAPHKVGDVQGTVQRLLHIAKGKKSEVVSAPPIAPRYTTPATSYASAVSRGTPVNQPSSYAASTYQDYYHMHQQQTYAPAATPSYAAVSALQPSYTTTASYNSGLGHYAQAPYSIPSHQTYQQTSYQMPLGTVVPPASLPQSQTAYDRYVPEPRSSSYAEPREGHSNWNQADARQHQQQAPSQSIPSSFLTGPSKWGPPSIPPPALPSLHASQDIREDEKLNKAKARSVDSRRDLGLEVRAGDDKRRRRRDRSSSSESSTSEEREIERSKMARDHSGGRGGEGDADYSKVAKAIREFLMSKAENQLSLTDFGRFYKEYPEYREALKGHVKDIVAHAGSGLVLTRSGVALKGKSKKSAAVPSPSVSPGPGSESPSKKAARAARFGNDAGQAAQVSTYEKITLESQRVAAALESAERTGGEVDWDSLVLKGTCTTLEKPFLRLTAPPDPATVRPESILMQALEMILGRLEKEGKAAYSWASDQLKSIRQDVRVQHIQNEFTVKVYESHARAALKYGAPDFQEFNQCSTQVKDLYALGLGEETSKNEFAGYLLLYHVYCKARYRYPSSFITLSLCNPKNPHDLSDPEAHAHALDLAIDTSNWMRFFRLYNQSPGLGKELLRPVAAHVRILSTRSSCSAAKTVPKVFLYSALKFVDESEWNVFCEHFKVAFTSPAKDVVDAKPTLQALSEVIAEGTVWT